MGSEETMQKKDRLLQKKSNNQHENTLLVIAVLLVGGCASMPTEPVKELTLREKVIGGYQTKKYGITSRTVLLDSGIYEIYLNGKKFGLESKWSISKEGEIILKIKVDLYLFIESTKM